MTITNKQITVLDIINSQNYQDYSRSLDSQKNENTTQTSKKEIPRTVFNATKTASNPVDLRYLLPKISTPPKRRYIEQSISIIIEKRPEILSKDQKQCTADSSELGKRKRRKSAIRKQETKPSLIERLADIPLPTDHLVRYTTHSKKPQQLTPSNDGHRETLKPPSTDDQLLAAWKASKTPLFTQKPLVITDWKVYRR